MVQTYELTGIEGLNCIELSNHARKFFNAPLILFSEQVQSSFADPNIPLLPLTELIESQCDRVRDRQQFDLCIVGSPECCSIATVIDGGLLYLNGRGRSQLLRFDRFPMNAFIDGFWRVRQEWLCQP